MHPEQLRIFIIDDEECIRDSLSLHLMMQGHEVFTFASPTDCPAFHDHACQLQGACADIVIVDYNMPGVTGLDFLHHLTRHGCQVIPPNRILITGDATPELRKEIKKMGCNIVQKPLDLQSLDDLIKKARPFISTNRKLAELP